jgi:hypothetical protein
MNSNCTYLPRDGYLGGLACDFHNQTCTPTTRVPTHMPSIAPKKAPTQRRAKLVNMAVEVTTEWSFQERESLGRRINSKADEGGMGLSLKVKVA